MYEYRDRYGPYLEIMDRYAFSASLDLPELQASLCRSHEGMGMATTRDGRFKLAADEYGLQFVGAVDPLEADAGEMVRKLENRSTPADTSVGAGDRGYAGEWNDDYTVLTILRWSLSRGEVSILRAGANPGGWADVIVNIEIDEESESEEKGTSDEDARPKPYDEDKSFDLDKELLATL